jgi:hypothetical protein
MNERRETRADKIVIMHPDGMAVVPETPQSFSTVHNFQQGHRLMEGNGGQHLRLPCRRITPDFAMVWIF